jgi:hypothetical protein
MMSSMSTSRALVLACVTMAPFAATSARAAAPSAFNGTWSVLIVTDKGSCDRAYRYPVRVANGRVSYAGQADFDVAGHVSSNGAVNVTVSKGSQRARGSGRLSNTSGYGTWRGGSGENSCSGSWTAEKRG